MPLEFDNVALSPENVERCENTIGPNTFFMLVMHAIVSGSELSVVRMGDGERMLYEYCARAGPDKLVQAPDSPLGNDWLQPFGCYQIPTKTLYQRIETAANRCTYFAPQIMGMQRPQWAIAELFAVREKYVDNWFVRQWTPQMQDQLYQAAKHVLVFHGDSDVRQRIASRVNAQGASVVAMNMRHWNDADEAISFACNCEARLVLFAGGPANKFIATKIPGKVVLDIGQALAKEWL